MAPLLKPSECSLLVLDSAGQPAAPHDGDVRTSRDRLLQAAAISGIPAFLAIRDVDNAEHTSKPACRQIYSPPMPGSPWGQTPLGIALAEASRSSLLICGYWLDECVTFTSLNALGEGYDIYLVTDASPPLDTADRHTAILRLVQAGVVPTTSRQAIREWAGDIANPVQRNRLLALA